MSKVVALTGATGFIGGYLLQRLTSSGVRVRALSRRQSGIVTGVEWVQGTLDDPVALEQLVAGAGRVIHCAGAVRGASAAYFEQINTGGSLRLLQAVQQAGCCTGLLLVSSLAARHPQLSWYAASKRHAEDQVIATARGLPVTVFRPTAVYGPGDRELHPVFSLLMKGWLPVVGPEESHLSFLHVDDLTGAMLGWLDAPAGLSGIYELHDGRIEGYSWRLLASLAEGLTGRPVRLLRIPAALLEQLARLNTLIARLSGYAPMLTSAKLNELRHTDWSCNNKPLEEALGWKPAILLEQALAEKSF